MDEFTVFSLGQGGCNNIVVVGIEKDGNMLVSVLHFSPTRMSDLIGALSQERGKYADVTKTMVSSFMVPEEKDSRLSRALSNSIGQFPNVTYEKNETNERISRDSVEDILKVSINKRTKKISIEMKGQKVNWGMGVSE